MTPTQRKQMHRRLNAIDTYKELRRDGKSHKYAIECIKLSGLPFAHIRKCEHSPFRSETNLGENE